MQKKVIFAYLKDNSHFCFFFIWRFFWGGGSEEDNLRPKLISFEFKDRPAKPKEKGEVNSKMKVKLQMYSQVAQDPPFI